MRRAAVSACLGVMLAGCRAAAPVSVPVYPAVVEVEDPVVHFEELSQESVQYENCSGAAELAIPVERSRRLDTQVRLTSGRTAGTDGFFVLSSRVQPVDLLRPVAEKVGVSGIADVEARSAMVLTTAAGQRSQHSLRVLEQISEGRVVVRANGRAVWSDAYRVRSGIQLRSVLEKSEECASGAQVTVTLVPPALQQPNPPATSAPTPTLAPTPEQTPTPRPRIGRDSPYYTERQYLGSAAPDRFVSQVGESRGKRCLSRGNGFGLPAEWLDELDCEEPRYRDDRWVIYRRFEHGFIVVFDGADNDKFQSPQDDKGYQRKFYALQDNGRAWRVYRTDEPSNQLGADTRVPYPSCSVNDIAGQESGLPIWPGFDWVMCNHPEIRAALGRVMPENMEANAQIAFQSYSQGRVFEIESIVYVVHTPTYGRNIGDQPYLEGTWRSTERR